MTPESSHQWIWVRDMITLATNTAALVYVDGLAPAVPIYTVGLTVMLLIVMVFMTLRFVFVRPGVGREDYPVKRTTVSIALDTALFGGHACMGNMMSTYLPGVWAVHLMVFFATVFVAFWGARALHKFNRS